MRGRLSAVVVAECTLAVAVHTLAVAGRRQVVVECKQVVAGRRQVVEEDRQVVVGRKQVVEERRPAVGARKTVARMQAVPGCWVVDRQAVAQGSLG